MGIRKRRTFMNACFKSQFNYYPLIWMCCNRSLNNEIDLLHERSLRVVYSNKTYFSELLEKDGSVSIYYQNIRQLAIEMLKVSKGFCPEIVKGLFQFRYDILYNLRQRSQFHIPPARTVFSGTESIKYLGPKIWELIPDEIKELESLWEFKRAIKLETHILPLQTMQAILLWDWFSLIRLVNLNRMYFFLFKLIIEFEQAVSRFNFFKNSSRFNTLSGNPLKMVVEQFLFDMGREKIQPE